MLPHTRTVAAPVISPRAASAGALALALFPNGVLWLDSAGLANPQAHRTGRVPFVFASGRVDTGSGHHTASEVALVIEAAPISYNDHQVKADLTSYARFVVATSPSMSDRLSGRTLTAWAKQR